MQVESALNMGEEEIFIPAEAEKSDHDEELVLTSSSSSDSGGDSDSDSDRCRLITVLLCAHDSDHRIWDPGIVGTLQHFREVVVKPHKSNNIEIIGRNNEFPKSDPDRIAFHMNFWVDTYQFRCY